MRLIEHAAHDDISKTIAAGDIAIVRGFASVQSCQMCIEEAIGTSGELVKEVIYRRGVSFVSTFDGGSPIGYYRFYRGPGQALGNLRHLYDGMHALSSRIRSDLGCADDADQPYDYHMELLRYSKGNFFQRHTHEVDPQKVGLICLLSGHYEGQGGTVFYSGDDVVETAGTVRQGDLLLFPWGIEHEVTRVEGPDRWVALLPYY